jgi:hypothetical protein
LYRCFHENTLAFDPAAWEGVGMVESVKRVMVGARVDPSMRAAIEARGDAYPNADGSRGNMSVVLREWFDFAVVLCSPDRVSRVRRIAAAKGRDMVTTWTWLVDRALDAAEEVR